MEDAELGRTIEAILLVAVEPLAPSCWPSCSRSRWSGWTRPSSCWPGPNEAEGRGFMVARIAGGARFQTHPDLAPRGALRQPRRLGPPL